MADNGGTIIRVAAPRSVAGIGVFRDRDRFRAAMHDELGVSVPTTPRFVQAGPVRVSCLAPARYLASAEPDANLPDRLDKTLAGLAAITDQSDMWEAFSLSGPSVRELLARLVPIDLAPSIFRIGDVACTRAIHLDVRLWRVDDWEYELAVSRSYAGNLRAFLAQQACVVFHQHDRGRPRAGAQPARPRPAG